MVKWLTMHRWLEENPGDEFASEVRTELTIAAKNHTTYTREYFGWGAQIQPLCQIPGIAEGYAGGARLVLRVLFNKQSQHKEDRHKSDNQVEAQRDAIHLGYLAYQPASKGSPHS